MAELIALTYWGWNIKRKITNTGILLNYKDSYFFIVHGGGAG